MAGYALRWHVNCWRVRLGFDRLRPPTSSTFKTIQLMCFDSTSFLLLVVVGEASQYREFKMKDFPAA